MVFDLLYHATRAGVAKNSNLGSLVSENILIGGMDDNDDDDDIQSKMFLFIYIIYVVR